MSGFENVCDGLWDRRHCAKVNLDYRGLSKSIYIHEKQSLRREDGRRKGFSWTTSGEKSVGVISSFGWTRKVEAGRWSVYFT